eukprot:gnl/TRDRNA2_/TRDRNA2_188230_c0_seq1.p1 gnl/TRDRNA2_/TRDRNA2_188230_c0~~gnl/TRDRNA2_/TRDRNA2_188230_c0_seq1.p1  ORF type:complete len:162 (+),score=34.65 gnl/TRDRNA2_/TRDRNA2_188230_c0_seq1:75-488(+)
MGAGQAGCQEACTQDEHIKSDTVEFQNAFQGTETPVHLCDKPAACLSRAYSIADPALLKKMDREAFLALMRDELKRYQESENDEMKRLASFESPANMDHDVMREYVKDVLMRNGESGLEKEHDPDRRPYKPIAKGGA